MTELPRLFLEVVADTVNGQVRTLYLLSPLEPDIRVATRAWRLQHEDKIYDVAIDVRGYESCTCQDSTFRNKRCKHILAIRALGLLPRA